MSSLLTSEPAITLEEDVLTVTGTDVTVTLSDRTTFAEESSVDGTAWTMTSLDGPAGSVAAPEGASFTIAEGAITVATGCNRGGGDATVEGETFTVGPLRMTQIACPPELAPWEQSLLSFLEGAMTYELSADRLVLTRGDTTLTLEPLV